MTRDLMVALKDSVLTRQNCPNTHKKYFQFINKELSTLREGLSYVRGATLVSKIKLLSLSYIQTMGLST